MKFLHVSKLTGPPSTTVLFVVI